MLAQRANWERMRCFFIEIIINEFDLDQFGESIAETDCDSLFQSLESVKTLKIPALLPILERYLTTN